MNEQQLFEAAYAGLAKQGFERSKKQDLSNCLYRGPDGRKCAIGHAIPDELYAPTMDATANLEHVLGVIGYSGDYTFARNLQRIHDRSQNPAAMQRGLIGFARAHSLTTPQLESES